MSLAIELPLLLPGAALGVVIAVLTGPTVARTLATNRGVATLLIAGAGLVLAATVAPDHEALFHGRPSTLGCDVARIGLAPPGDLVRISETSLNVALFVPVGLAAGLLPRSRSTLYIVLVLIALPFAIEAYQLALPVLGRGCQTADIVDNLSGFVVGYAAAKVGRSLLASVR